MRFNGSNVCVNEQRSHRHAETPILLYVFSTFHYYIHIRQYVNLSVNSLLLTDSWTLRPSFPGSTQTTSRSDALGHDLSRRQETFFAFAAVAFIVCFIMIKVWTTSQLPQFACSAIESRKKH